jgi:hypothetical protein
MNWFVVALVSVLLLFVYMSAQTWGMARVRASNGRIYLVQRNSPGDPRDAAEQLARLEARVDTFVEHLKTSRFADDCRVKNVIRRWAGRLSEVNTAASLDAAYSINKSEIAICIRDAEGRLQDDETAMFILLHELAHLSIDSYGHTDSFWKSFRLLLKIAIEDARIYADQNFEKFPVSYCDQAVRSSPYTCLKNGNCAL